jgi:hypothetical protein
VVVHGILLAVYSEERKADTLFLHYFRWFNQPKPAWVSVNSDQLNVLKRTLTTAEFFFPGSRTDEIKAIFVKTKKFLCMDNSCYFYLKIYNGKMREYISKEKGCLLFLPKNEVGTKKEINLCQFQLGHHGRSRGSGFRHMAVLPGESADWPPPTPPRGVSAGKTRHGARAASLGSTNRIGGSNRDACSQVLCIKESR